jgi:hypothetical protein
MRCRKHRLAVISFALALIVTACGGGGGVSIPFPFAAGTTWTYRYIQDSQEGIVTQIYEGQEIYRGLTLHRSVSTNTLQPNALQRTYFQWTTCRTTRAIVQLTQTTQVEIVFDQGIPLTCSAISMSGSAQIYVNGTPQGVLSWAASSSDGGEWVVTVPSGTYRTRRWNVSITLATQAELGAVYVARNDTVVLLDVQTSSGIRYRWEHLGGPASSLRTEGVGSNWGIGVPLWLGSLERILHKNR